MPNAVKLHRAANETERREARKASRRSALGFVMALPPILLVLLFVGLPVITALAFSLGFTGGLNQIVAAIGLRVHEAENWWGTFAAYQEVLTNAQFLVDFATTVLVTIISAAIVLFLAMGIGLYLRIKGGWIANLLASFAVVPLFIPVVIAAWSIVTFYAGNGFIRSVFAQWGIEVPTLGFTVTAIVIGSVWTALPFAVLMIASGFQAIPDAMIEAARDAGAKTLRIAASIMLPMAFIPIVIAGTFTAIGVIGSFTVPYFTGPNSPNMLGVTLTSYFSSYNQPQQSIVMAFTIFVTAAAIGVYYVWANFRGAKEEGRI